MRRIFAIFLLASAALSIASARLSSDGRTVTLAVPTLAPTMC